MVVSLHHVIIKRTFLNPQEILVRERLIWTGNLWKTRHNFKLYPDYIHYHDYAIKESQHVKRVWLFQIYLNRLESSSYFRPYCIVYKTGKTKSEIFDVCSTSMLYVIPCRADSRLPPCQWETSLQSNTVSHWLVETLESAPPCYIASYYNRTLLFS